MCNAGLRWCLPAGWRCKSSALLRSTHIEVNKAGYSIPGSITIFNAGQASVWGSITASVNNPSQIAVWPAN